MTRSFKACRSHDLWSNDNVLCPKRHTDVIFKYDMLVNAWVYIHISMDLWHLNNAYACLCVRVCERGRAERNEGHPDDLDSCKWRRLMETYQYWCFFCFLFFFVCVYVWRIPPQLDQFSLQWTNTGQACAPPSTPCLPVNGHPSDCQGISQVVQLTLTYFNCVVWGSISFPLVSVKVDTQGLVWNTVMACMAAGCLMLSLIFDSDKITEWPASTSFPGCAVTSAFHCPQNRSSNLQGIILISLYCSFPLTSATYLWSRVTVWLRWKQVFESHTENISVLCGHFFVINRTAIEVQVYLVTFMSHQIGWL